MNILLIADMEGCIGTHENNSKIRNLELMRCEISQIITYLLNTLSNINIDLLDCHDNGRNLPLLNKAFPNINIIEHVWNFDEFLKTKNVKYDFSLLIGLHSKSDGKGIFPHSFRADIEQVFVGKKIVGETELYINWLKYYDIPTIFISGDNLFIKEIKNLNCIKYISKSKNTVLKDNFEEDYKKLCEAIIKTITNFKPTETAYDSSPVFVKLKNKDSLKYFPCQDFDTCNDLLKFNNTLDFIKKLQSVCLLLNVAVNIISLHFNKILREIKRHFTPNQILKSNDDRLIHLLNGQRNIYEFTKDDFTYFKEKLNISV